MKVSSNLLKSIAIGVALGAGFSSCTQDDTLTEFQFIESEIENKSNAKKGFTAKEHELSRAIPSEDDYCTNCPACGLG